MTNQEKIFNLLAVEGDCWHKDCGGYRDEEAAGGIVALQECDAHGYGDYTLNPDLTTPDGVMWMLVRLEKWDRFALFCSDTNIMGNETISAYVAAKALTWLAADAKDGKAPALFNALCEFLGLEI